MAMYDNGVMPLYVEPMNRAEMSGLSSMANYGLAGGGLKQAAIAAQKSYVNDPTAFAAKYTNPMATKYMDNAGNATASGISSVGFNEVEDARNPYAQALKNRLSESAQRAKAALLGQEGMRGGRSFGSTATGTRLGMLDTEVLNKGNDIDYQTYQDALAQKNLERNRMLSGGAQYGNLAQGAQGITDNATRLGLGGISTMFDMGQAETDQARRNAQDQIYAGGYIRNYNQGVADIANQDILDEQNYPRTNLANTISLLNNFKSGTGSTAAQPTTLGRIGSGLQFASGALSGVNWSDPWDVVPDGKGMGPQQPWYQR